MEIETLIKNLRETDPYIETIFSEGSCYKFYLFLRLLYPTARAMINKNRDHVITEYKGRYYDITGRLIDVDVCCDFGYLTLSNLELVEGWSFSKYHMLQVGECEYCEEPVLV